MSRVLRPDTVFSRLNDLQRQLNALARTSQLANASITQGSLVVEDGNGNVRVRLGELPSGDYGLAYSASDGYQELFPFVDAYHNGTISTTSTAPVALSTSPTVTATVGASGDVEITVGAYIGITAGAMATIGLVVDNGPAVHSIAGLSSSAATAANVQSSRRWISWQGSAMAPGEHSFSLRYDTTSGTAHFSAVLLKVQPF